MTDDKDALRQRFEAMCQSIFHEHDDPARETPEVWRDVYNAVALDLLARVEELEAERDGLKNAANALARGFSILEAAKPENPDFDHAASVFRRLKAAEAERDRLAAECAALKAICKPALCDELRAQHEADQQRITELLEEAKKDTAAMLSAAQTCQDGKQAVKSLRSQLAASQARVKVLEEFVSKNVAVCSECGSEDWHDILGDALGYSHCEECKSDFSSNLARAARKILSTTAGTSALDAAIAKARGEEREKVIQALGTASLGWVALDKDSGMVMIGADNIRAGLRKGEKP